MVSPDDASGLLQGFERYLRENRMRGRETAKRYVLVLRGFAGFLERAGIDLGNVTDREVEAFIAEAAMRTGVPSPTVWNGALSALRSFFGYLVREGVVRADITIGIERKKVASKEPVPLSIDEFDLLVDTAKSSRQGRRDVAILEVLFHTALRVRELVSLDLEQVDWHTRTCRDVRTKGGKWISSPFNDQVASVLEAYLAERDGDARGPLFTSRLRRRISVRAVQEMLRVLGKRAGILRPVTPHLFRHTCATELSELGTPIRVVQQVCGHASVTTTETYIHVKNGACRQAIDALGRRVAAFRTQKQRAAASFAS